MVETKRMRTEHLDDKGAATDANPRTHRTEDMDAATLREFDACREYDATGKQVGWKRDKLVAFHTAHPEVATDEGHDIMGTSPDADATQGTGTGEAPTGVRQFGDTRQAPGAARQPETTVPATGSDPAKH